MLYSLVIQILVVVLFSIRAPFSVQAQVPPKGLESCFLYYDYGKVKADLSAEKAEYNSQETIKLHGTIVNENTFPLVDVVLYAHIRRVNENTYLDNGHHLIDKITLLEHINLLQQEAKSIEVNLPLKSQYPQGDYQIQYYIFSPHGFHYGGRPFLEEDFAGLTNFILNDGSKPDLYFDIDTIKADGQAKTMRGLIYESTQKPVTFDIKIVDNRSTKSPVPVRIKYYSFEDSFEDKLVSEESLTIDDTSLPLHLEFTPPEQGAYVLVVETDSPVRSMLKYRFAAAADKAAELRMNDVGVSSFPSTANGRAWVCFHSPMRASSLQTTVMLSLLDNNQKVIEQTSLTDSFSSDVFAISLPLAKLGVSNDFWVEAQVINQEDTKKNRSVRVHYQCNKFAQSLKDFTVKHVSQELLIEATDACGKQFTGGTINMIRIMQNGTTKKEETNVSGLPYRVSLEGLAQGTYNAEVSIGDVTKKIQGSIAVSVPPKSDLRGLLWKVAIFAAGIFLYILYKSKKRP